MANKETIIIIAVCVGIAALVVLYTSIRIVKHYSATSNPLPPPQPLAHIREQQLAKFENTFPRSQTWYMQSHLSAPHPFENSSAKGSSASLIPTVTSPSISGETTTAEDSMISPLEFTSPLPLPNPSFHPRPGSSGSSHNSSETGHHPSPGPSQPPTPPLELPLHQHPRSSTNSSRRSRPLSLASSHSTLYSKTSRHTLRGGVPHGPHSQIQIVLPAPLGSDLYNPADASSQQPISHFDDGSLNRKSVVDRWVSTADMANLAAMHAPVGTSAASSQRDLHRMSSAPTLSSGPRPSSNYPAPSRPPVPPLPTMYKVSDMGELQVNHSEGQRRLQKKNMAG